MTMQTQQSFNHQKNKGKLFLVPTPIGNLDDMTFRAVQTLKDVDLIACEDTRVTQKLLNHFDIHTKKTSYHEHNIHSKTDELIEKLLQGAHIAQVSDAGMPSISDPGMELVEKAIKQNISVIPLPGANAAVTALIASGVSAQPFTFYGFLSRKKTELKEELESLKNKTETLIFYESPYRLEQLLKTLNDTFGAERKIALGREITKRHEEFVRGNIKEALEWVQSTKLRGEFVVIVAGNEKVEEQNYWTDWTVLEHIEYKMKFEKKSSKEAIKEVARERKVPKNEIYATYHRK